MEKAIHKKPKHTRFERNRLLTGILFLVPSTIICFLFVVLPVLNVIKYSFNEWPGIDTVPMKFVGFDNYAAVPKTQGFGEMIVSTITFALGVTILTVLVSFIVAMALDKRDKGRINRNLMRSMWFFPCLLGHAVVGILWRIMYHYSNGVINKTIVQLGGKPVNWLETRVLTNFSIIVPTVWVLMGMTIVIFLAGLQSIPTELYEASTIDGANKSQVRRFITIPMMAPSITINVLTTSIAAFKMYELPWFISLGLPGYSTRLLTQRIYFFGFENTGQMGIGAALSMILILTITLISLLQFVFLRKREDIF
ncbi:MAG: sugar ABC transporter permease [Clostridiaceae bacterium]|jgi:ABC-type sugar transport system permease subunit|nr:sugar ABC transporter permease [Clostridiaceae bacterium]